MSLQKPKIILISQRVIENLDYPEQRDALDTRWAPLARNAGLLLVPAGLKSSVADYFALLDVAGCILSGGNNIASVEDTEANRTRDTLERHLIDACIERSLPMLGVCRGCQFLWHYFGGTLQPAKNHTGVAHDLNCLDDNLPLPDSVKSFHDFSLGKPPTEVRSLATAPDSTVEAWRHASLPIVGIMWHPEREENPELGTRLLQAIFYPA